MPLYAYVGQNAATGKKTKGAVEADSMRDARLKLRNQKIYVLDIKQDDGAAAAQKGATFLSQLTRRPPKQEDLALATKQFAILTRAAVDISEALKSISEQVDNAELRSIYVRIRELVTEGKSLSDAHREFPTVFSLLYVNMLSAAERSGALPLVLRRLSDFILYSMEIRRKVVGAITYPAIMVVVCIGVMIFLFVNVLPKMTKAFSSLKVTLPWYTVMLNSISAWMQQYWLISILCIIGMILGIAAWIRTPKGRYKFDLWMLTLPVVGPVTQKVAVSRFSKTLSTVLSSGVRIVEALTLTRNVIGNAVLEAAIDETVKRVQDGEKLAAAVEKTGRFPTMLIHMLRTGEKTGKLEEMLTNIAEAYDEEVDHQISATTKLITPILTMFIAGMVALIVAAIMGPLMQAMSSLK
jgi:general secretion pathway protein F